MGSVRGLGHAGGVFIPARTATLPFAHPDRDARRAQTTRSSPRTSTTSPASRRGGSRRGTRRADARGKRAPGVLRLGAHRRGRGRAARAGSPNCCHGRPATRRARRRGRVFKIERAPAGEKIAYVRMFSGTDAHPGPGAIRRRSGAGKVTAIGVFPTARPCGAVGVGRGGRQSCGAWRRSRIGDAIGGAAGRASAAPQFAPPTLETVVVPRDPGGAGRAAVRARPSCRAGPADQRPPGRRPPGDLGLALRRGAEGGHRGHAGRRLRPGRRLP